MRHLDEGTLQALLDGELSADESAAAARHLEHCPECAGWAAELRAAAGELASAVQLLDRAPSVAAAYHSFSESARADRGRRAALARRLLLRAAVLVLVFGGLVSAALPGSPVRGWVETLWERTLRTFTSRPAPSAPASAPTAVVPAPAGLAIMPVDGRVRIVLEAPAPDCQVRVRLVDGERAVLHATGGAASARFRTAPGRIEMVGGGVGEVRVELPRSARDARVEVNGKPYVIKDGDTLRLLAPLADTTSAEMVFRVQF